MSVRKPRIYLIVNDSPGSGKFTTDVRYFIEIGLGLFWTCSSRRADAREFTSRNLAVQTLHRCRKHLEGWRIIADVPLSKDVAFLTFTPTDILYALGMNGKPQRWPNDVAAFFDAMCRPEFVLPERLHVRLLK